MLKWIIHSFKEIYSESIRAINYSFSAQTIKDFLRLVGIYHHELKNKKITITGSSRVWNLQRLGTASILSVLLTSCQYYDIYLWRKQMSHTLMKPNKDDCCTERTCCWLNSPLRILREGSPSWRGDPRSRSLSEYASGQGGWRRTHHTCPIPVETHTHTHFYFLFVTDYFTVIAKSLLYLYFKYKN